MALENVEPAKGQQRKREANPDGQQHIGHLAGDAAALIAAL